MSFITSLRIKNFFSIKDEVNISFKASPYNIENNPDRLFEFNGEYYNKIISFYGANASGKTTVLKAIIALADIARNQSDKNFPISFKNKFNNIETSSELSITFVLNTKNIKQSFSYQVEFKSIGFENIGITDEKLYMITNNQSKAIILIDRTKKVIFGIDDSVAKAIFDNLKHTKSLIKESYKFESTNILKKVDSFFDFIVIPSNIDLYQSRLNVSKKEEESIGEFLEDISLPVKLESFYLSFFNSIGIDIHKIKANYTEIDGEPRQFKGIKIFHNIKKDEPLEFGLESDGTQMLMKILLDIFVAKITEMPLIIDELDSIVHPMLVPIIINLLIANDIQIIYSTHNIYNMKFLRNDEIFLIEKDTKHQTTIKPVKDNTDIKGYKNLLTLYENGYLGGVPEVEELITKIL